MQRAENSSEEFEPLINDEEQTGAYNRRIIKNDTRSAKHHRILVISLICAFLFFIHILIFSNVKIYNRREVIGWSKNKSRETANYILPYENTTILEPSNLCRSPDPILLMIVVCSSPANFDARQAIRDTWGNTSQFNYPLFEKLHGVHHNDSFYLDINHKQWRFYVEETNNKSNNGSSSQMSFKIEVVFLLGVLSVDMSDDLQNEINYEHDVYGDIIQENFLDSYNNLTLKSISMLKWVTNNCIDKVKYIMKCDDDTFVNIPNLIHVLLGGTVPLYKATLSFYDKNTIFVTKTKNRLPDSKQLLLGYKFCNAKKILDTSSKWYAPNYMFSGDFYPDYLSGTAYILTNDTGKELYNGSLITPVFHLEDVYLTGFVAEKIKMKRSHHPLFFYQYSKDRCSIRGMISQHKISAVEMEEIYNFVTNLTIHCAVPEKNFMMKKLNLTQRKRCH